MDWGRVNAWTTTLYTLIHSLRIAKAIEFGNMPSLPKSILEAGTWLEPEASYSSVLASEPFGRSAVKFRRNPNIHFEEVVRQVICMLVQDLVVIFDQMMDDILAARSETAGVFPQSKIEKLATHLDPKFEWAKQGCLELIAARNVLTHARGRWNKQSIAIISFVDPIPSVGDELIIGFPMLFRYRKAMRTFLNEVTP
ncbi:hypothetical protein [Bradyrhizobium sp.]|uniref:hypothetical protein n=1 Tax=Bradyrhizobium sp. TaxID=376 RepID=UPI002D5F2EC6|nr:hypothetical protein [Bradyrhizobium sp.]HZR76759.1 hypothetical protein [Bradyrhizobium sp.]